MLTIILAVFIGWQILKCVFSNIGLILLFWVLFNLVLGVFVVGFVSAYYCDYFHVEPSLRFTCWFGVILGLVFVAIGEAQDLKKSWMDSHPYRKWRWKTLWKALISRNGLKNWGKPSTYRWRPKNDMDRLPPGLRKFYEERNATRN